MRNVENTTKTLAVLATAEIRIQSQGKVSEKVRCLVDSGAQMNLITLSCARRLDLKIQPTTSVIAGIGGSQKTYGTIKANIYTKSGGNLHMQALFTVVPKILNIIPSTILENSAKDVISEAALADTNYHVPAPVEIILGVGICAKIFNQKILELREGLVALHTRLGYVIFGECAEEASLCCHMTSGEPLLINDDKLDAALERLWKIDLTEIPASEMTPDEVWCEENFKKTCFRDHNGRYVTTISIKPENLKLGQSYDRALERFKGLERRLQRDESLAKRYIEFMREYETLGHMKVADRLTDITKPHFYIPHHPVLKKFRVVFDASAKTTNGKSLNDIQLAGPKIQLELYDIILRFRTGRVALTADVAKMFRQVRIVEDQWDLQRIIWRENPRNELKEYWLTVITYGLTSAGYNAVKAMLQCANDNRELYPIAAKLVPDSFYMDDLLVSVDTLEEAKESYNQIKNSLASGGFELAKWCSNFKDVITGEMEKSPKLIDKNSEDISVLGLIWDPISDYLRFKVNLRQRSSLKLTKRIVASEGAMIFDPNGYLTPITIQAKTFLQNLWRIGVQWDEELSVELSTAWSMYYNGLSAVSEISIPRWIGRTFGARVQIHAFCDASIKAYGAVLYMRSESSTNGDITVSLLTSKSKVADLQTVSIPRMELCAAKLASEAGHRLIKTFNLTTSDIYYWTDSQIVLHWLSKFPSELKVFVGNRVSAIQACSKISNWKHVDSKQNPADIITRGLAPAELTKSSLWWDGPDFLKKSITTWPKWKREDPSAQDIEIINGERRKVTKSLIYLVTQSFDGNPTCLLIRFEKLQKVVRTTAYVMRFIAKCKAKVNHKHANYERNHEETIRGTVKRKMYIEISSNAKRKADPSHSTSNMIEDVSPINVEEYKIALSYWIKYTQKLHFPEEIQRLSKGKLVPNSSKIVKFVPFIDNNGLMRMRGRIERSSLTYDQKHPIILSGDSTLAKKLIVEAHQRTLHGGSQLCIQYLRDMYWITGLRSAMRMYIRKCVRCTIHRKNVAKQIMADLPQTRVQMSRPFANCGVDYAGPFSLKPYKNSRGTKIQLEAYVAVFVCFATKAVHLELVGDLTTQAFLAALDRMILRRNHVQKLHSDQGRNFIGAANELDRVYDIWQSKRIIDELTVKGITWQFNTPLAPHHGGLWEAAVKSFKFHLYRVLGQSLLTFEELNTLIVRIEGCLNSRPLVSPKDDPQDLTIITPGHLVTGEQVIKPLGPEPANIINSKHISWNEIRDMEQDFWQRWSSDYIVELQKRTKWFQLEPNIKEGDLVVMKADNMPPSQWQRGRIIEIFPGQDGAVRSVTVKTASGEYQRPITRLCVLPVNQQMMDEY